MAGIEPEQWSAAEKGNASMPAKGSSRELRHGRTAHNMSSSSLRKKSDIPVIQKVPYEGLKDFLSNLQEAIPGTKLAVLFPAIPAAVIGNHCGFSQPAIFGLSLLGLTPLAERVSFLRDFKEHLGPIEDGKLNESISTSLMNNEFNKVKTFDIRGVTDDAPASE